MDNSSKSEVVVTQQNAELGIRTTKPKFPEYEQVDKRHESYFQQEVIWPSNIPVSVDALVAAGLVFTGLGDSVRCYHCGGGLRNWETGQDPMVEHAKWYPNCSHVNLVKGKDFVNRIADRLPPEPEVANAMQTTVPTTVSHNILETDASQAVIQMGYTPENILKAIHILSAEKDYNTFFSTGKGSNLDLDFTGGDLCEILMEMEDNPRLYSQYDDGSNSSDSTVFGEPPSVEQAKASEGKEEEVAGVAHGLPPEPREPEVASTVQNTAVPTTISQNILEVVASQAVIQMGYSPENVLKAIHIFKCRKCLQHCKGGNLFLDFTGRDLCEILMEMEENPRLYNQYDDGSYSSDSSVADRTPSLEQAKALEQEEELDIEELCAENERLKENYNCKICLDARADVIFLPCGHIVSCPQCAPAMNMCPMCKKMDQTHIEGMWERHRKVILNCYCKICLDARADVIFLSCGHMVSCPQCAPAMNKCLMCRKVVNGLVKAFFATRTEVKLDHNKRRKF